MLAAFVALDQSDDDGMILLYSVDLSLLICAYLEPDESGAQQLKHRLMTKTARSRKPQYILSKNARTHPWPLERGKFRLPVMAKQDQGPAKERRRPHSGMGSEKEKCFEMPAAQIKSTEVVDISEDSVLAAASSASPGVVSLLSPNKPLPGQHAQNKNIEPLEKLQ